MPHLVRCFASYILFLVDRQYCEIQSIVESEKMHVTFLNKAFLVQGQDAAILRLRLGIGCAGLGRLETQPLARGSLTRSVLARFFT